MRHVHQAHSINAQQLIIHSKAMALGRTVHFNMRDEYSTNWLALKMLYNFFGAK